MTRWEEFSRQQQQRIRSVKVLDNVKVYVGAIDRRPSLYVRYGSNTIEIGLGRQSYL